QLPEGFLTDRQGNRRATGHVSFFLNHAALAGCEPIVDARGKVLRAERIPRPPYGLKLQPRGAEKLVEHWPAELGAGLADLLGVIKANQTMIIGIVLHRVVREGVFRFTRSLAPRSFKDDPPGSAI